MPSLQASSVAFALSLTCEYSPFYNYFGWDASLSKWDERTLPLFCNYWHDWKLPIKTAMRDFKALPSYVCALCLLTSYIYIHTCADPLTIMWCLFCLRLCSVASLCSTACEFCWVLIGSTSVNFCRHCWDLNKHFDTRVWVLLSLHKKHCGD